MLNIQRSSLAGAKIRIDNLHYELGKDDLEVGSSTHAMETLLLTCHAPQDLFLRKGPVLKVDIRYDRAGRSEGVAFVTYEALEDARAAIRDYDGANANGV